MKSKRLLKEYNTFQLTCSRYLQPALSRSFCPLRRGGKHSFLPASKLKFVEQRPSKDQNKGAFPWKKALAVKIRLGFLSYICGYKFFVLCEHVALSRNPKGIGWRFFCRERTQKIFNMLNREQKNTTRFLTGRGFARQKIECGLLVFFPISPF